MSTDAEAFEALERLANTPPSSSERWIEVDGKLHHLVSVNGQRTYWDGVEVPTGDLAIYDYALSVKQVAAHWEAFKLFHRRPTPVQEDTRSETE